MNLAERDQVRQELLELRFGCHPDPTALEARLAADPEVQALDAEVQREAGFLVAAAKDVPPMTAFIPPMPIVAPGGRFLRRFAPAAAAAALLLVGSFAAWNWAHPGEAERAPALVAAIAPAERGLEDVYTVDLVATDESGRATPAAFTWTAFDARDRSIATAGLASATLHRVGLVDAAQVARLDIVEASSGLHVDFRLPDRRTNGGPLVHLTTCRPVYAPGDVLHWRAVVLDHATRDVLSGSLRVRLVDPAGNVVQTWQENLEDGVSSGVWTVAGVGGRFALEVRNEADDLCYAKLPVLVQEFQAPRFETTITLDQATYAPGARGIADVELRRLDGTALGALTVDASIVVDGQSHWSESARADSGRARFVFSLPGTVERGEGLFVARVNGGDVVETAVKSFVVPLGKLDLVWSPEGGEWPVGYRTRLYAEVRDLLGRPTDVEGRIVDDTNREIATFATEHQGRGRLELTAEPARRYRLVVDDPPGLAPAELPVPVAGAVALRARSDTFPAGEPLVFEVETPSAGPWLAAAYARDRFVGHALVQGSGRHEIGIALPAEVAGVLRVTLFDAEGRPVAERLVARRSSRELAIEVAAQAAELPPGAPQRVTMRVRDPDGRPVMAILGVAVNDAAEWAFADRVPVGLVDTARLVGDVFELEHVQDFLADDRTAQRNIDLLLGTRGWRRFAWRDPEAFVAAHGEAGRRLLARDGVVARPRVVHAVRRPRETPAVFPALGAAPSFAFAAGLFGFVALVGRSRRSVAFGGVAALLVLLVLAVVPAERAETVDFGALSAEAPASPWPRTAILGPAAPALVPAFGPSGVVEGRALDLRLALRPALVTGSGQWPESFVFTMTSPAGPVVEDAFEEVVEQRVGLIVPGWIVPGVPGLLTGATAWNRIYAHVHVPAAERQDFAGMLYWNALLRTDANGVATVDFQTSDRVTTWDVRVDVHGAQRIGQARTSFRTKLPLRVEPSLPVALSSGDRLLVPVSVNSEDPLRKQATVSLAAAGPLRAEGAASEEIALEGGRGRRLAPVVAESSQEVAGTVVASVEHGGAKDRVRRTLPVTPRGFPRRLQRSGTLERSAEAIIPAPEEVVAGSVRASLKVYPSTLSSLEDGLDGMLAEPGGCFEQTSSRNYPNVLALTLLRALGDGSPALEARARRHLETGYRLLTGFECRTGGFEWFGKDPAHPGLTAYGLLQFHDMAKVFDVDRAMMERTRRFLLELRDGQGGFRANRAGLHSWRMDATEIADAYLAYALLATGAKADELRRELDRLASRAKVTSDAYELAVAAVALDLGGREEAEAARARLGTMQREDGAVAGALTSITGSGGNDLLVETTSFAVLAWLAEGTDRAKVDQAIRWLVEQRSGIGTFGTTQATVMALKALYGITVTARPTARDGMLRVFVNDGIVAERSISAGDHRVVRLDDLDRAFVPGDNRVRLEVDGRSDLTWALDYAYTSSVPADDTAAQVALEVGLSAPEAVEGATVGVTATVRNVTGEALPMTIAVVGLPAGLVVRAEVLDAHVAAGRIDHWETIEREVVFYWRGLAANEVRRVPFDTIATWPGDTTGRASRALLYYTPESTAWAKPVGLAIRPRR